MRHTLYPRTRNQALTFFLRAVIDPNENATVGRPVETYVELPESLRNIGKKPVELNRPVKKSTDGDAEGDVSGIRAKHDAEKKNTA